MPAIDLTPELQSAIAAAWHGAFGPSDALLARLAGDTSEPALATCAALRAHSWLAGLDRGSLPDEATLSRWSDASESVRKATEQTCIALERACLIAFDANGLRHLADVHRRASGRADEPWTAAADLWARALAGGVEGVDAAAADLARRATELGLAPLVIELSALRALVALAVGDLSEATRLARRASRMARTEALPQPEYLANLVLARARRACGRGHLATRIAGALARVVPPPWHGWIEWERAFAALASDGGESEVASAVWRWFDASVLGDEASLAQARAVLVRRARSAHEPRADVACLDDALDASVDPATMTSDLGAWARGEQDRAPRGLGDLAGTAPSLPGVGEAAEAWVIAGPGRAARRALNAALGRLTGVALVPQSQRVRRRTERGAAILSLAGPRGIATPEFFERSYGFPFEPETHASALRVLLHRVRTRLEGLAAMERDGEQLRIVPSVVFAVADPRTATPVASRVLAFIASRPSSGAKEIADALSIPLRTVQQALAALVDEGACVVNRDSRQILYDVEDTTFSQPTESRWRPV